jgi:metalloendopeptidase OMA1, mitochondrial
MKQLLALAFLILMTGCSTMDAVTGQKTSNFYSIDQDVQFGSDVQSQTLATFEESGVPLNADPVRVAQLQQMVTRIAAVSDLPDLPYEVTLIHTNVVNAMAAPGGKIMVYEGLWDPQEGLARDEDEIAAVMAHEIAHVNARHSTEAMTRAMPVNLIATIGMIAVKDSKYEELGQMAAAGGMFLYNGIYMTRYSRVDEFEADAVGMMYMAKAGYDPRAAVRIWERVASHQGGNDPASSIFSTHPSSSARVMGLRQKLPEAILVYEAGLK